MNKEEPQIDLSRREYRRLTRIKLQRGFLKYFRFFAYPCGAWAAVVLTIGRQSHGTANSFVVLGVMAAPLMVLLLIRWLVGARADFD